MLSLATLKAQEAADEARKSALSAGMTRDDGDRAAAAAYRQDLVETARASMHVQSCVIKIIKFFGG